MKRYFLRGRKKPGDFALKKIRMALFSGALFLLAGTIEVLQDAAAHGLRRSGAISAGVMFACVGILWISIGARWKKERDAAQ